MATELKEIIQINAAEGLRTLKELRANITEYRAALAQLGKQMEEYQQRMNEAEEGTIQYNTAQAELNRTQEDYETVAKACAKTQAQVNDVMNASKKYVNAADGSMNQLLATLRQQKEEWKSLGDSQVDARNALTERINETKAKINALNESIGNFQHNVGNYSNSIIDAFTKMGLASTALDRPLKKVGIDIGGVTDYIEVAQVAFQQFNININTVITSFKSATVSAKAFIGGLTGIQKAIIATGIGAFLVALGALVAYWKDITNWLYRASAAQRAFTNELKATQTEIKQLALKIAEFNKDQDAIERRRKELFLGYTDVDFAREDLEKAQAVEKQASEAVERAEKVKEKASKELKAAQKAVAAAKTEDDIAWAKVKEEQALKNWTEASFTVGEAIKQVGEARRGVDNMTQNLANYTKAAKDAADKTKDVGGTANKAADEAKRALQKLQEQAQQIVQKLDEAMLTPLEKTRAAYEKEQETLEAAHAKGLIKQEDYERGMMLLQDRYRKERNDIIDADIKEANEKAAEAQQQREQAAQTKYQQQLDELEHNKRMQEGGGQNEDEPSLWDLEARFEQYDADLEAYKAYIEAKIALNTELMEAYSKDSDEYKRLDRENAELRMELDEQEAAVKRKKDADEAKLRKARQAAVKQEVSLTSGLLKDLSSVMGESTKMGKGFAIAAATIDTIAAAVSGFRAGFNQWADSGPMAWMAPVQAAINATAALVAGYAQIQKISSVDTSGNATAGGAGGATALAMPNIDGLSSPIDYTRQVTTQTEREEMNNEQRVYILESDIQASNRRVTVRENETTF